MDSTELEQVKEVMANDPAAAPTRIQEYLAKENSISLNIGVTGDSGSGKSTFVNAFLGINNMDDGAAPTGSAEIQDHHHPEYPSVVLWDLPGIGAPNFPADEYLQLVGIDTFDFFIIISDTRFRENDVKLVQDIKKMGKKFYFVRSKIDNDLRAVAKSQKDFRAETTVARIRENCIQGLQEQGLESPQVFLLSSFELHQHDFLLFRETFERELPELKRNALLLSMSNINLEIINKKKAAFQAKIKYYAAVAAAVAAAAPVAAPVPGLSVAVELGVTVAVVTLYVLRLGLNVSSVQRIPAKAAGRFSSLKAVLKTLLAVTNITKDFLLNPLVKRASTSAFVRWIGMGLSFSTTYNMLNVLVDVIAVEAQTNFKRALGLNTSV